MLAVALGSFSSSICHSQQSQELRSLGTGTGCCNFSQGFQFNLGETLRSQQGKSHQSDAMQGSKDLLSMHIHESPEGILKKLCPRWCPQGSEAHEKNQSETREKKTRGQYKAAYNQVLHYAVQALKGSKRQESCDQGKARRTSL